MSKIKGDAVKRLFAGSGFTYGFGLEGSKFTYSAAGSPFTMAFAAPWLKADPLAEYDLVAVRKMLTSMLESARAEYKVYMYLQDPENVDMITRTMTEFGMTYDEADRQFYYVRDGKAVFGVDFDYIASMICTGKTDKDKLLETLGDMLETAEYEAQESKRARKLENGSKV